METKSKDMQADCTGSYPNVFFFSIFNGKSMKAQDPVALSLTCALTSRWWRNMHMFHPGTNCTEF